jgi:hypothetical protein
LNVLPNADSELQAAQVVTVLVVVLMPDIWQLPAPLLKQLMTKRSPLKEKIGPPWLVRRAGRGEPLACT